MGGANTQFVITLVLPFIFCMMVDIGGVRQVVNKLSKLLQAVYTKPLHICCGFANFEFKFWVPQLWGKGAPMVMDISGVGQGVSELLHAVYTNLQQIPICCSFATVLKLNFGFPNLGERGPLWGGPSWCQMVRQ